MRLINLVAIKNKGPTRILGAARGWRETEIARGGERERASTPKQMNVINLTKSAICKNAARKNKISINNNNRLSPIPFILCCRCQETNKHIYLPLLSSEVK